MIDLAALTIEAPFQMRRRGVELKLHLGEAPAEIDRTLVWNIMTGRNGWQWSSRAKPSLRSLTSKGS